MLAEIGPECPDNLAMDAEMTVLFSDMRGFTELAEAWPPRDVYAAINASLAIQTRLVLEYGGSVNKFLGDGLLACFSGPDRASHAVSCVRAMIAALPGAERQGACPPGPVGFGINDGRVLLGLLGIEERRELTVIGDVANTAARLCGIAEPFQALLSADVVRALPEDVAAKCRYHCRRRFKGKSRPMDVYRIVM